jgi:WhiB family redox-sensing transcriptional regulator
MEYHEQEWREEALCRQTDPELWFDIDRSEATRQAKAVCSRCPVVADCLAWALEVRLRIGTAGGLTVNERAKLLKERDAA